MNENPKDNNTIAKKTQMINGRAFEYALLHQFWEKLKEKTRVEIIQNSSLSLAENCFQMVSDVERSDFLLAASFAVNTLADIEPRLSNDLGVGDILQLELRRDKEGEDGDVRDLLAIRLLQKWEIGISAKNNHDAVKHSRLSPHIDFGEKWMGMPVSKKYFQKIKPIFEILDNLKKESGGKMEWKMIDNLHEEIYKPLLDAFSEEIINLDQKNPGKVPGKLVEYLVGKKDFYKVIKKKKGIEISAFNLFGTLNQAFKSTAPKYISPILPRPTKIESLSFKDGASKTTVILKMDGDWTLSFRIHNASTIIEPSLKFDVKLISSPKTLFKNTYIIGG